MVNTATRVFTIVLNPKGKVVALSKLVFSVGMNADFLVDA